MKKKNETKKPKSESGEKVQKAELFKKRNISDTGQSVLDQLKKATEAEKEHRKGTQSND